LQPLHKKLWKGEIITSLSLNEYNTQKLREKYIRVLAASEDSTKKAKELADDLFALDLTVYSQSYSFDSLVYSAFAQSKLDKNVVLHPEQLEIIKQMEKNDALIVSAPTSFGKTFCAFEYIARHLPRNIVLIVPTLALIDEYLGKLIRKYNDTFQIYKVYTQLDPEKCYDFDRNNIFILTHDRVVQESSHEIIKSIDLLVIDEVYKLETDKADDRVLVLNMAYYHLAKMAKRYILLAPFIQKIEDIEILEKKPAFYNTEYSPVVNEVIPVDILSHKDRNSQCKDLLQRIPEEEKTLIYFPTVVGIYKYINDILSEEPLLPELEPSIRYFVEWAKDEIHEDWCVTKALERGYVIHNGQMPLGTRMFQLNLYEKNDNYNRLFCTSTLLEGVNTTAKNIIITKPSRLSDRNNNTKDFTAFDFYNLVGRTGRLNQHFIGKAYYLKAPTDPPYEKIAAIRSIKFELTDDSKDVDIQKGDIQNHPDYLAFLSGLGITHDDYLKNIGSHLRFDTVLDIYNRYTEKKAEIIAELRSLHTIKIYGRNKLIVLLYYICEGKNNKLRANLINNLIHRNRPKIKTVVEAALEYYATSGLDYIISEAINLKMSYIEHQFYGKVQIVKYFMQIEGVSKDFINVLEYKVLGAIEQLYFTNSKQRKMLLDIGVYERDVEPIIRVIGGDYEDAFSMKKLLKDNLSNLQHISYISRYIINNL